MSHHDQAELITEEATGNDEFLVIDDDSDIIFREKYVEDKEIHTATNENNAIPLPAKPVILEFNQNLFSETGTSSAQLFSNNLFNFNNLENFQRDQTEENLNQSKNSKSSKATGKTKKIQKDPLNTTSYTYNTKLPKSDEETLLSDSKFIGNSSARKISQESSDCHSNLLQKDKVILKLKKDKRRQKNKLSGLAQEVKALKEEMFDLKKTGQSGQLSVVQPRENSQVANLQNQDLAWHRAPPTGQLTYVLWVCIFLLAGSIFFMGPWFSDADSMLEINWPKIMFCILYMITMTIFLSESYRKVGLFHKNPYNKDKYEPKTLKNDQFCVEPFIKI